MPIDTVVFIPGICGSVLKEGGTTIWPGTPANKIFQSYPDEYVRILSTSHTITAPDVLRSVDLKVLGQTIHHFGVYGDLLMELHKQMGYSEDGGTLVPFAYDWRLDIRVSAKAFHDRLSESDLTGRRVAIVAHSMGGLVARYALEVLGIPAGLRLELLALLATPHLGAPAALQNVLGLRPEIFLSARQCRDALQNPDFPSAYQLLPQPGVPALLAPDSRIGFVPLDAYGAAITAQFGLSSGSLTKAAGLSAKLPFMGPGFRPPCPYLAIAGNAQKTILANYLIDGSATPVDEGNSGDGTVPLWSAAPPGIPVRYVSAAHLDVCTDADTLAMLKAVLRPDIPGGRLLSLKEGAASFSLQPLKTSVAPGEAFTVAIVANRPFQALDAQVVIQTVFDDKRTSSEVVPVRFDGGPIRSIPLEFKAPDRRGIMLFTLQDTTGAALGKQVSVLVVA